MSLNAPDGLIASARSNGTSHIITWNNNDVYDIVYIEYNSGSGWTNLDSLDGLTESYVNSGVTANTTYNYRVYGVQHEPYEKSDYSDEDETTCWSDTLTETLGVSDTLDEFLTTGDILQDTLSLSDVLTDVYDYADTITDTLTLSDYLLDAQTLRTDYAYYLLDSSGNTYQQGSSYKGDAGTAISSVFESKNTDFADQDIESKDQNKELFGARLHYKDLDASTVVSVSYSTDGGTTWVPDTKTLGTGDGTTKSQEFFFRATAHTFKFKIDHASSDKDFQWSALEVFYLPAGEFA